MIDVPEPIVSQMPDGRWQAVVYQPVWSGQHQVIESDVCVGFPHKADAIMWTWQGPEARARTARELAEARRESWARRIELDALLNEQHSGPTLADRIMSDERVARMRSVRQRSEVGA